VRPRCDLDGRVPQLQALAHRVADRFLAGVQGDGKPVPRAHDVAGDLAAAGVAEPHGFGAAIELRSDVDEIDRIFVHDTLAKCDEPFDERAQPKALHIDCSGGLRLQRHFVAYS
jgi:hypothetical protein